MSAQIGLTNLPKAEWRLITPEMAAEMLKGNFDNRSINMGRVKDIAQSIKNGTWIPNNDAIVIAMSGRVLNGQHRLTAIVSSATPVIALVMVGADDAMRVTMDTGRPRAAHDVIDEDRSIVSVVKILLRVRAIDMRWENRYTSPHRLKPLIDFIRDAHDLTVIKHPNRRKIANSAHVKAAFCYSYFDRLDRRLDISPIRERWDAMSGASNAPPSRVLHAFVQSKMVSARMGDTAFLRALRIFDDESQDHIRLCEMNKNYVVTRISEIFSAPFNEILGSLSAKRPACFV